MLLLFLFSNPVLLLLLTIHSIDRRRWVGVNNQVKETKAMY